MALTEKLINGLTPSNKDQWVTDGEGLRLLVKTNGKRYWRFNYRFTGKQKTLALGVYPVVSLKAARLLRDKARITINEGIDPAAARSEAKSAQRLKDAKLFSELAKRWWEHDRGLWTKDHAQRVWTRLKDNSFRSLDLKPIEDITPKDVLEVVRSIEDRGAHDVAGRVLQDIRRSFKFGVREGWLKFNPAAEMALKDILKPHKSSRRPSMNNNELGLFQHALDHYRYKGRNLTELAIKMLMHTFLRPGELRGARWCEFDLENALWRIPDERMKMNTPHIVPLSRQVLAFLDEIKGITGGYELLFPSEKDRNKPMSDNTMRRAMFKLGWDGLTEGKSKATPHGFRANASSILNEQGFRADAVERQLSHMERNDVRRAYIYHAQFLDERKVMMQWWSDFLDKQKREFTI